MLILAHKEIKGFFGHKRTNLWTKRIFFLVSNLVADNLNYINRRIIYFSVRSEKKPELQKHNNLKRHLHAK